jgi:hypothetical protein
MCELFGMSSRVTTALESSLAEFARHGGLSGPHHDGWGVAYFEDGMVRTMKETTPAGESAWMRQLSQHSFHSELTIGHIRHATQGVPALVNTQPFVRFIGGNAHVFAHGVLRAPLRARAALAGRSAAHLRAAADHCELRPSDPQTGPRQLSLHRRRGALRARTSANAWIGGNRSSGNSHAAEGVLPTRKTTWRTASGLAICQRPVDRGGALGARCRGGNHCGSEGGDRLSIADRYGRVRTLRRAGVTNHVIQDSSVPANFQAKARRWSIKQQRKGKSIAKWMPD